jgi:uncharacterized membrane protein YtjA (UPF0391 family)
MLGWALTFLVIALIAAVLGFGGIAGFAVEIAKIIFVVAIILFVISAVVALIRGRSPTVPLSKLPHGFQARACSRPGLAGRELLP